LKVAPESPLQGPLEDVFSRWAAFPLAPPAAGKKALPAKTGAAANKTAVKTLIV
jgi:hypothetical protein